MTMQPMSRRNLHRACAGPQGNSRVVEAESRAGDMTWEPCKTAPNKPYYYATAQGIALEVGVSFERLALL
jgi:hypothetical protein